jgi:DNA-binding MarR family transcriptional regulator
MDAPATRRLRVEDLGIRDSLVQLSFLVQDVLARIAAAHDLPPQQARLLGILRDREPGMARLAELLGLDKSSTTGLVARAERRGLLKRRVVPEDRRAVRVTLTEQGRELASRLTAEVDRELHQLVEGMAESNQARLSLLASQVVHLYAHEHGVDLSAEADPLITGA